MSLSGIGNSDIFLLKCLRLLPGTFLYTETLRTWCARVGNSPRRMPRQDKSPAGWRGGTRYCCGTPHARGWETRAHGVRGWDYWEDEELRFTRHEDRSGERNEELACTRSEEWAVAHDEERPAGVAGHSP